MAECERCGDDAAPGEDLCYPCIDEAEVEWANDRAIMMSDYRASAL